MANFKTILSGWSGGARVPEANLRSIFPRHKDEETLKDMDLLHALLYRVDEMNLAASFLVIPPGDIVIGDYRYAFTPSEGEDRSVGGQVVLPIRKLSEVVVTDGRQFAYPQERDTFQVTAKHALEASFEKCGRVSCMKWLDGTAWTPDNHDGWVNLIATLAIPAGAGEIIGVTQNDEAEGLMWHIPIICEVTANVTIDEVPGIVKTATATYAGNEILTDPPAKGSFGLYRSDPAGPGGALVHRWEGYMFCDADGRLGGDPDDTGHGSVSLWPESFLPTD